MCGRVVDWIFSIIFQTMQVVTGVPFNYHCQPDVFWDVPDATGQQWSGAAACQPGVWGQDARPPTLGLQPSRSESGQRPQRPQRSHHCSVLQGTVRETLQKQPQ